jgi:prevent-host-death family protein
MEIGVRQLREELRRWLDAVERGEEVTITERGRPVARLISANGPTQRERLIAQGILTPAERPKRPSSALRKVRAKGNVTDFLAEQRR